VASAPDLFLSVNLKSSNQKPLAVAILVTKVIVKENGLMLTVVPVWEPKIVRMKIPPNPKIHQRQTVNQLINVAPQTKNVRKTPMEKILVITVHVLP
jgi:hypothetical protein